MRIQDNIINKRKIVNPLTFLCYTIFRQLPLSKENQSDTIESNILGWTNSMNTAKERLLNMLDEAPKKEIRKISVFAEQMKDVLYFK